MLLWITLTLQVKTTGDKDALNTEIHILLALVTDKIQRKYPPVTQLVDFNLIYAGLLRHLLTAIMSRHLIEQNEMSEVYPPREAHGYSCGKVKYNPTFIFKTITQLIGYRFDLCRKSIYISSIDNRIFVFKY